MIFPRLPAVRRALAALIAAISAMHAAGAAAEDGYRLWLRYTPVAQPAHDRYAARAAGIVAFGHSTVLAAALGELDRGLAGMLGQAPATTPSVVDGSIVLATPDSAPELAARAAALHLAAAGPEGFVLQSTQWQGHSVTLIAANTDVGLLYGSFRLLGLMQRREPLTGLQIHDAPRLKLRVLDRWDNPDRSIERG